MVSYENLLGIPKNDFGSLGIVTGNIISQEIEKQDKGLKAIYNSTTKKITILNSSNLPQSVLYKILYNSQSNKYKDWYPEIEERRNEKDDFKISFKYHWQPRENHGQVGYEDAR